MKEEKLQGLLESMTLKEKAFQLTQAPGLFYVEVQRSSELTCGMI